MTRQLDILARAHADFLGVEERRARKRGPRDEAGRAALRPVIEVHRSRWLAAGGDEADFALAPLLEAGAVDRSTPADSPPTPKRKGRK
jgi:hypothetical protein